MVESWSVLGSSPIPKRDGDIHSILVWEKEEKMELRTVREGTVSLRSLLHLVAPLPLAFFKARRRVWKGATTGN